MSWKSGEEIISGYETGRRDAHELQMKVTVLGHLSSEIKRHQLGLYGIPLYGTPSELSVDGMFYMILNGGS